MAILLEISIYKIYATDQAALYKKKNFNVTIFFQEKHHSELLK